MSRSLESASACRDALRCFQVAYVSEPQARASPCIRVHCSRASPCSRVDYVLIAEYPMRDSRDWLFPHHVPTDEQCEL
jgi:hypothetical protein